MVSERERAKEEGYESPVFDVRVDSVVGKKRNLYSVFDTSESGMPRTLMIPRYCY